MENKNGQGISTGEKTVHQVITDNRSISLKGKSPLIPSLNKPRFVNEALTNFDLMK